MKKIGTNLLISMAVAILSSVSIHLSSSGDQSCFITLDVCHASAVAFTGNAGMPVITESPFNLTPL